MVKVKPFSRNTRLENHSDEPLKVAVTVDSRFQSDDISLIIEPGEHRYMCYADLEIEYNGGRLVEVFFYIGDRHTKPILTSQIRDHEKIIFFKREDGNHRPQSNQGQYDPDERDSYLHKRRGEKDQVIADVDWFRIPVGVIEVEHDDDKHST